MIDIGVLPRRRMTLELMPVDVFEEGIPGIQDNWWLLTSKPYGAPALDPPEPPGVSTSTLDIDAMDFDGGGSVQIHSIEDLCDDWNDGVFAPGITSAQLEWGVGGTSAVVSCPTRLAGDDEPAWLDDVEYMLTNMLLNGLADDNATAIAGTGSVTNDLKIASAAMRANWGFQNLVGISAGEMSGLSAELIQIGNQVFTVNGTRVWQRYSGTAALPGAGSFLASGQLFYELHTERVQHLTVSENLNTWRLNIWAVVATDLPSFAIGT